MKTIFRIGLLILLLILQQRCAEDEARSITERPGTRFSFLIDGENDDALSCNGSASVTIEDNLGNVILTNHHVTYNEAEGNFVTDEISLPEGRYKLIEFTISGKENTLFTANTKADRDATGSLSSLPISFTILSARQSPVDLKTLAATANTFQISVYDGGRGNVPISATARFVKDGKTLRTYSLRAGLNTITFDLDPALTYELVVEKKGYARQTVGFNYSQIRKPLSFYIIPAFTMLAMPAGYLGNRFEFNLDADPGASIKIYWGDGTSQSYTFVAPSYTTKFTKHYASTAMRYVWVTGDIDEINYFYSFYGSGAMKEVDFHRLTGINEIRFGLSNGPDVIDLSNNTNLVDVRIMGIPQLQQLIMPSYHFIEYIDISGPNAMNTAAVDAVIGSIYNMSVAYGIVDGTISVAGHWGGLEGEPDFIGPPSALGLTRLEFLRDVQSWYVVPESW